MYFCSICLKTYKDIEDAILCCAVELNSDENDKKLKTELDKEIN